MYEFNVITFILTLIAILLGVDIIYDIYHKEKNLDLKKDYVQNNENFIKFNNCFEIDNIWYCKKEND